ncbi:GerAB/ArcD/ProY family transporter [Paenibacillus rigui]|nr:endospore germination permease [Paenibacillus rigui]
MERISQIQLFMLFALFSYSTPSAFLVSPLAAVAKYDLCLAFVLAAAATLFILYFSIKLGRQQPAVFFADYGGELVGKWLHSAFMVLFLFYFLQRAAIVLRNITDFMIQTQLPNTPSWAVAALFGLCIAFTIRSGIESIFRLSQIFFIIIVLLIIGLTPLFLAFQLENKMMVAFLTNHNWRKLALGTFQTIPWYGDTFLVLFLFPYLAQPHKTMRSLFWAVILGTVFILSYVIPTLLMFGPLLTASLKYPVLEFIRSLRIADFIETLDPFLTIIWLPIIVLKISLLLYTAIHCLMKVASLKDYKPLTYSMTTLMIGYSVHMAANSTELEAFILYSWPAFAITVQCLPLLYLAAGWLRSQGRGKVKAKDNANREEASTS